MLVALICVEWIGFPLVDFSFRIMIGESAFIIQIKLNADKSRRYSSWKPHKTKMFFLYFSTNILLRRGGIWNLAQTPRKIFQTPRKKLKSHEAWCLQWRVPLQLESYFLASTWLAGESGVWEKVRFQIFPWCLSQTPLQIPWCLAQTPRKFIFCGVWLKHHGFWVEFGLNSEI